MKIFIPIILIFCSLSVFSQIITKPNSGTKSHPTLEITKIDRQANQTVFYLSVTNQNANGDWFCADKNIYVSNVNGKQKYKLTRSENIAVCPDSHKFTAPGQVLAFVLYFPVLDQNIKYIDLVEDCNDYCFSFKGVILSPVINSQIESAYGLYAKGKLYESALAFENLQNQLTDYPYSFIYFNLIKIYAELNNTERTKKWFDSFASSACNDKEFFLQLIKTQNIYNPK